MVAKKPSDMKHVNQHKQLAMGVNKPTSVPVKSDSQFKKSK